jgi:hypothetical protein
MKTIAIIFLLFSVTAFGQWTPKKPTAASKYSQVQSVDGDTILNWVAASTLSGGFSEIGVSYFRGATDTIGASWVDTLSRKLVSSSSNNLNTISKYWWQASITSDDTIEVSTSSTFTAGLVITVLPDIPLSTPKLLYSSFTNLYIRKPAGVAGIPRYYVVYQGN